jgi:hypothetical protein
MRLVPSGWILLVGLWLLLPPAVGAQATPDAPQAGRELPSLRVFLDCERRCDFDYFRQEVPLVDWVRDREVADLHVLITQQPTGGGGTEYSLLYIGLDDLASRTDTLLFVSRQVETDDEIRAGLVRTFRLGLAQYLVAVGLGDQVDLTFTEEAVERAGQAAPEDDPWNLWVFRTSVNAEVEGESRTRSRSYSGSVSAGRTTRDLKVDFWLWSRYESDEFEISDEQTISTIERNLSLRGTSVWSLSDHWSLGGQARVGTNTVRNQDLSLQLGPALEYSVFPYEEATRRQITALYQVAVLYNRYDALTLFERLEEVRPEQRLEISADFQQPWGQLFVSLEGSHFLDDPSQHRISLRGNIEIRIIQGLNLDLRGRVARIKDQIYIPAGDIPPEEIFLERTELGTDFEYSLDVGLSFTFGSVFNNVVNPRMFGGGGRWF